MLYPHSPYHSEIINENAYVLSPKKVNWFIPDEYDKIVQQMTQFEPADRPKNMKEVRKMLEELINIRHIHFDFDFFMENPDTDEITGERI